MKLFILLAFVWLSMAAVHRIPLVNVGSRMSRMMKAGTWRDHIQKEQNARNFGHKTLIGYPQTVSEYLFTGYLGNITVGTPEQQFLVILDTSSANMWIPDTSCGTDVDCEACQNYGAFCVSACVDPSCCFHDSVNSKFVPPSRLADACNDKHHKFNQNTSTTYLANGKNFFMNTGYGNVTGYYGQDTVRFGGVGTKQLVVPKVTFAQATHLTAYYDDPVEGVVGLAFPSKSVDGVLPPLYQAINQGLLDQPLFTVFLKDDGDSNGQYGGVFTYGGIDTDNCGDVIAYQPLTTATNFQFKLSAASLGSYSSDAKQSWTALSDTGISHLGVPQSEFDKIVNATGATYDEFNKMYFIYCDANPGNLNLKIGANTYEISPSNYIVPAGNGGECILGIFAVESGGFGPSWLLGDVFIRQYCNIFDYGHQRIGFAPAKQK